MNLEGASSCLTPVVKLGCLEWLPRTMSRWLLSISEHGDSRTSLGNLCQCMVTLTAKMFFIMFRWTFSVFDFVPLALVLSLGATEEKLPPLSFSALQVLIRTPLSLISSRLTVPALSACSHRRDAPSPIIIFMALCWTLSRMSVSLLYWGAWNWTQNSSRSGLTRAE